MPVGGTAIARAIARARELLASDPKSHDHSRVILVVTDGEDMEGDPVSVARSAGQEGTIVDVVQIGGRTPERIPEIGPDGKMAGYRKDDEGKALTTSLSAEGEAQLEQVAHRSAGGKIVRSERGTTGIDTISQDLKRKMTEELASKWRRSTRTSTCTRSGRRSRCSLPKCSCRRVRRRRTGTGTRHAYGA